MRVALQVQGNGPPLVLLHGLGCSRRYFAPLHRELRTSFTLYTPDFPGHGRSSKPAHRMWRLRELTDIVSKLIPALALERPVVAGHSLGGGVAVDLARRYPGCTRGLALLAPTGVPITPSLPVQILRIMIDALHEPLRLYPLVVPAYLVAGPRRILRLATDQARYGPVQGLQQIDVPILILRGHRDPIVTLGQIGELLRENSAASYQEVPGAAHAHNVSHPAVVAQALRQFAAPLYYRGSVKPLS